MDFRLFELKDAFEVSKLIKRSVRIRDNSGYTKEQIDSLADYYSPENFCLDLDKKVIYICAEGNKILGTATLLKDYIMAVFIDPDYQRRGIGKKLMFLLEKYALKKGYSKVWLIANFSAVSFYEKLGYVRIGEKIHPHWGKGVIMEKVIFSIEG